MEPTHRTLGVRRAAALVAATAAAALAVPAAANAAVTGQVTGTDAVLVGDDTAETITIGVDNGLLTHNLSGFDSATDFDSDPGVQTLPANAGTLTIDGRGGDDNITAGPNEDHLIGGAGSDRLTGFRGDDEGDGGDGNDVFIWNNGDGTDTNDGDDNVDEQVMNGRNTTDDMTVKNLAGGRVRFDRADPGKFGLDLGPTIERLTINSLQGDDKLVTEADVTLPITVDAGAGADADHHRRRCRPRPGRRGRRHARRRRRRRPHPRQPRRRRRQRRRRRRHAGVEQRRRHRRHERRGRPRQDRGQPRRADDISSLKVRNGKVRYDRANAPFGLNVATSEVFELNTFGGNDTLDVPPGLGALIAVVADAGTGNDRLNGGDEPDTFFGGLGDDTLDPGAGVGDAVDGQDGNDTLNVRDNAADLARGGAGTDSATADREDILVDVESQDVTAAPASPDTQGTAARVRARRITSKLKKGVYTARIRVECPASEAGGCTGVLALQTRRTVSLGGTRFRAVVASKRYTLKAGQRKTLKVKLRKGVRALSRRGTLSLNAITTNRDAAGNLAQRSSRLSIRLVR